MRYEVWWVVYVLIVCAVVGVWLRHRRNLAWRREVGRRAAQLASPVLAQWHPGTPPPTATVYWSKEAIREDIIKEYDSSRTTVIQRAGLDREMLKRVWNVARDAGRRDRSAGFEDHEPVMSRDLDINRYGPLRMITCDPVKPEVKDGTGKF